MRAGVWRVGLRRVLMTRVRLVYNRMRQARIQNTHHVKIRLKRRLETTARKENPKFFQVLGVDLLRPMVYDYCGVRILLQRRMFPSC